MKKRMVAVTMAVITGLVLGFPMAAAAQTSSGAQQGEDLSDILQTEESKKAEQPSEAPPSEAAPSEAEPSKAVAPAAATPAPQPANAAPVVPQPSHEGPAALEEIVVTARRTAENLQDVPVAISAMSGADLAREQINTGQDLQGRVPSMVISTGGQLRTTETPTIRGQGATYGASPGVVIYFAEVPLPGDSIGNGQGGPGKFFDLANMQVLKGSQGTLFGRNTTGGALLLEPHKPDDHFAASLRADGSNYGGNGYEGVLNVPVAGDSLLLRVAAKYFHREGFTRDVVTDRAYDSKHFWTSRLGLTWKPTDGIENYLLGYVTDSADRGTSQVIEAINKDGLNYGISVLLTGAPPAPGTPPNQQAGCQFFNAMAPSSNCGDDIIAEQQARGIRRVQLADPNDILKTGAVSDTFSIRLTDGLTLRNIGSYSIYRHHYRWDLDGSRAALTDFNGPDNSRSSDTAVYTEELQLQGTALEDRLKFVTGGYYEYLKPAGLQENRVTDLFFPVYQKFSLTHRASGPYAQGTYGMGGLSESLEGLNVTVGARYTSDDIKGSAYLDNAGTISQFSGGMKKSAPTWTVGADYKVDTTMLYGKISRGYKSGGFSVIAANPAHYTFKPEFVTNYEIGHKSDLEMGSMPIRLNSALYFTDYTDMQRTAGDSYLPPNSPPGTRPTFGGATFNAGKASIGGFETDATVVAFTGFSLTANYSYTLAKYEEYALLVGTTNPQLDCSGQRIQRGQMADLHCMPFQSAPKHQYSVSSRYQLPVDAALGEIEGSLTYAWTGRRYSSATSLPGDEPGGWLNSLGLVNASVRWQRILNSGMNLQIYGTNLTNEKYRMANSGVWNVLYYRSSIYGEPRIFGLQLSHDWGD